MVISEAWRLWQRGCARFSRPLKRLTHRLAPSLSHSGSASAHPTSALVRSYGGITLSSERGARSRFLLPLQLAVVGRKPVGGLGSGSAARALVWRLSIEGLGAIMASPEHLIIRPPERAACACDNRCRRSENGRLQRKRIFMTQSPVMISPFPKWSLTRSPSRCSFRLHSHFFWAYLAEIISREILT